VKTVEEVKRHLNNYVVNTLFAGKEAPSQARRRYFPTTNDIRNILNPNALVTAKQLMIKRIFASSVKHGNKKIPRTVG
jgi:hypothetical protein